MKWSIAGLMCLGVVAAGCAAVLVASLRGEARLARSQSATEGDIEMVVALENLPVMTIVEAESVTVKKIAARDAPVGYVSQAEAVIGRFLALPVKKGQIFTQTCLARQGAIARLLEDGMRAINLSLPRSDVSLLAPGSFVDVLVSLKVPSNHQRQEAMSRTLLQGVEVLALDGRTLLSSTAKKETKKRTGAPNKLSTVTLMVSSDQAKVLHLAKKFGTLGVALRNPLDQVPVATDATRLSELSDEYSALLALLAEARVTTDSDKDDAADSSSVSEEDEYLAEGPVAQAKRVWEVEVLRGGSVEKRVFSMSRDRGDMRNMQSPRMPSGDSKRQEKTPSTETTVPVTTASQTEGGVE